jgi:tRNA dimethylallyltransferase
VSEPSGQPDERQTESPLQVEILPHNLLVILGPTGSGKSDLAEYLAGEFGGELVSCDSVQVYRLFDIGAAKTPAHLVDTVEPGALFTAGDYARVARETLRSIAARGRLPIVVGGTGFYLRALLHGLFEGPGRNEDLRLRLAERERRRPGSLHRILSRFDPESAARIHVNDVNKTLRALELCLLAQRPLSELFRTGSAPLVGFRIIKVGLNPPREALYAKLDQRFLRMVQTGLLDEVRRILAAGVSPGAKPFESLGYKQALAVVLGEMSLERAIASAQMETRRYAKRQMTWFRREPGVTWFRGFGDCPDVRRQILEFVQRSFEPA